MSHTHVDGLAELIRRDDTEWQWTQLAGEHRKEQSSAERHRQGSAGKQRREAQGRLVAGGRPLAGASERVGVTRHRRPVRRCGAALGAAVGGEARAGCADAQRSIRGAGRAIEQATWRCRRVTRIFRARHAERGRGRRTWSARIRLWINRKKAARPVRCQVVVQRTSGGTTYPRVRLGGPEPRG